MDNIVNENGAVELTERNQTALKKLNDVIGEHKLYWNMDSVYYVLDKHEKTFEELRVLGQRHEGLRLLILAGLPEDKRDMKEVNKIIDELREEGGISPKRQHTLFVDHLRVKHFFTDMQEEEDMKNLTAVLTEETIALQEMILELFTKNAILQSMGVDIEDNSNKQ